MTYFVSINDRDYTLADSAFEGLEVRVLTAVQVGGAFVEVDDVSAGPVRTLITPASSVASRQQSLGEELAGYDVFPDISFIELP